ncbi:hypothetical protein ANN_01402 [Periplaneta americana]|uniref:Uncharacterized protein n=1 Tax=Periplaneta americana TaxID=6978 RepID=A0ABQ8TTH7_PERAM|nr:hypothetical protein ANN_01402 [Periplaneta americana]
MTGLCESSKEPPGSLKYNVIICGDILAQTCRTATPESDCFLTPFYPTHLFFQCGHGVLVALSYTNIRPSGGSPDVMPNSLKKKKYMDFLENILPVLLKKVPLAIRTRIWFQHDGAPHTLVLRQGNSRRQHLVTDGLVIKVPSHGQQYRQILIRLTSSCGGHLKILVYTTSMIFFHGLSTPVTPYFLHLAYLNGCGRQFSAQVTCLAAEFSAFTSSGQRFILFVIMISVRRFKETGDDNRGVKTAASTSCRRFVTNEE